jgi:hypothetical protein
MVTCPEGHPNPLHWEFCGECGAPINEAASEAEDRRWYLTLWAVLGAAIVAVLVTSAAVVALAVVRDRDQSRSAAPTPVGAQAIREWWSVAHEPFAELRESLDDAQDALDRLDGRAVEAACQQMHDTADVGLRTHMPTPDPELTSELAAATADAHIAAHICLAAMAGSTNGHDAEFMAAVEQAETHMVAAQKLVNKALIASP